MINLSQEFIKDVLGIRSIGGAFEGQDLHVGLLGCRAIDDCEEYTEVHPIEDWQESLFRWLSAQDIEVLPNFMAGELTLVDRSQAPSTCITYITDRLWSANVIVQYALDLYNKLRDEGTPCET